MSQNPHSAFLLEAQFATLAEIGEERTANAGDVLYRVHKHKSARRRPGWNKP